MKTPNAPDPGDRLVRWRDPNSPSVPPPRRVPRPYPEDPESEVGRFNVELLRTLAEALISNGMWVRFRFGPFGSEEQAAAGESRIHEVAELLGLKIATLRQGWAIEVRSALEKRPANPESPAGD